MRLLLLAVLALSGCNKPAAEQPIPVSEQPKPIVAVTVPYLDDIRSIASFYFGIPPPVPVIVSQVHQESSFRADAVSPVGAAGLMQLMPQTAQWIATQAGFGIAAPFNPQWNLRSGIWYDRFLFDRVRAPNSPCDRWLFALASYNGGEGWTLKRQARSASPGSWAVTGNINPGITEANQRENAFYGPRIIYALQPKYAQLGPLVCKGDT